MIIGQESMIIGQESMISEPPANDDGTAFRFIPGPISLI
jgi:hypothetical protein